MLTHRKKLRIVIEAVTETTKTLKELGFDSVTLDLPLPWRHTEVYASGELVHRETGTRLGDLEKIIRANRDYDHKTGKWTKRDKHGKFAGTAKRRGPKYKVKV